MSGLSASTYSCGGEGARFLFAGEAGSAPELFLMLSIMPPPRIELIILSSSDERGEDRSESSEVDMSFVV